MKTVKVIWNRIGRDCVDRCFLLRHTISDPKSLKEAQASRMILIHFGSFESSFPSVEVCVTQLKRSPKAAHDSPSLFLLRFFGYLIKGSRFIIAYGKTIAPMIWNVHKSYNCSVWILHKNWNNQFRIIFFVFSHVSFCIHSSSGQRQHFFIFFSLFVHSFSITLHALHCAVFFCYAFVSAAHIFLLKLQQFEIENKTRKSYKFEEIVKSSVEKQWKFKK